MSMATLGAGLMNAEAWDACDDPQAMLAWLNRVTGQMTGTDRSTLRKLRLWTCACARRLWAGLNPCLRSAVGVGERLADSLVSEEDRLEEFNRANEVRHEATRGSIGEYARAYLAVVCVLPDDTLREHAGQWRDLHNYEILSNATQSDLLREIVGNPLRPISLALPSPLSGIGLEIRRLAEAAYQEQDIEGRLDADRLSVLADALEEAGCMDETVLYHLRGREGPCPYAGALAHKLACHWCDGEVWRPLRMPHYKGCWALDAALGPR